MAKCKSCGTEVKPDADICPKCGAGGTSQTITDLPANVKAERKKLFSEMEGNKVREEHIAGASCTGCGAALPAEEADCPSCGMSGGAQTISDLPPLHLREAHGKLKEEIREAREHEKE